MELDDFKKTGSQEKPAIDPLAISRKERIDSIVELFRAEDAKARKQAVAWAVVLVALSVIYFSIFGHSAGMYQAGMMILGAGMVMGAVYTWLSSRPVPDNVYTLPLISFLDFAERRLRYLPVDQVLKIAPILVVFGTGGGMVVVARLSSYTQRTGLVLIIWILFFISLCIFGYFAGRKNWERRYGDLFERIRTARKDLN